MARPTMKQLRELEAENQRLARQVANLSAALDGTNQRERQLEQRIDSLVRILERVAMKNG